MSNIPKLYEERVIALENNRELHCIFGGGYVMCNWSGTIGFLIHNVQETRCDRCRLLVWAIWDTSPVSEQAKWYMGKVTRSENLPGKVA